MGCLRIESSPAHPALDRQISSHCILNFQGLIRIMKRRTNLALAQLRQLAAVPVSFRDGSDQRDYIAEKNSNVTLVTMMRDADHSQIVYCCLT